MFMPSPHSANTNIFFTLRAGFIYLNFYYKKKIFSPSILSTRHYVFIPIDVDTSDPKCAVPD